MSQKITNLSELIKATEENLRVFGYTEYSLQRFRSGWNKLTRYAEAAGNPPYTPAIGLEFLKVETGYPHLMPYRQSQKSSLAVRSVRMLNEFQEYQTVAGRVSSLVFTWDKPLADIRTAFFKHSEELGLSKQTVRMRKDAIDPFLRDVIIDKGHSFESITPQVMLSYTSTMSSLSPGTISLYLRGLRFFFEFLFTQGYVGVDLSKYVPKTKSRNPRRLPIIISKDDLKKLLESVDRGNPLGKRDYAILLIAALLGLRDSDICGLTFDQLNWETARIELIQRKTDEPIYLPMLIQVRDAIFDYLKYGRPITDCKKVFVKHNAPYDGLVSLCCIMRKHMRLSGVESARMQLKGLHILRRTLASGLITQGEAYTTVSAALGHRNTTSTDAYAHFDIDGMIQCALDPMEVGFDDFD